MLIIQNWGWCWFCLYNPFANLAQALHPSKLTPNQTSEGKMVRVLNLKKDATNKNGKYYVHLPRCQY